MDAFTATNLLSEVQVITWDWWQEARGGRWHAADLIELDSRVLRHLDAENVGWPEAESSITRGGITLTVNTNPRAIYKYAVLDQLLQESDHA